MKLVQRVWLLSLFLLIVMATSVQVGAGRDLTWHNQQRISQLFVLLLSIVLWSFLPRGRFFFGAATWVVYALFLWGGVAALHASIPLPWSLLEVLWWVGLLALFECVAFSTLNSGFRGAIITVGWLLFAFSVSLNIRLLVGLVVVYFDGAPLFSRALIDGFSNSRFFGQFGVLVWPLLVGAAISVKNTRVWRGMMLLGASLMVLALLISQTRGVFYGLGVAFLLALVLARKNEWFRSALVTIFSGGAAYVVLILIPGWVGWIDISGLEMRFDNFTLSGRDVLWSQALSLIADHPWLGLGPMGFVSEHSRWGAHPHSSVLQVAVEWGIPALILTVYLVYIGIRKLVCEVRGRSFDAWGISLVVSLVGSLVQSLVDGVLVMPLSQTGLACCAGLAWGWIKKNDNAMRCVAVGSGISKKLVASFIFASLIVLFWRAATVVGNGLIYTDMCVRQGPGILIPRFWVCGWVEP